jgi:hypothetical protein
MGLWNISETSNSAPSSKTKIVKEASAWVYKNTFTMRPRLVTIRLYEDSSFFWGTSSRTMGMTNFKKYPPMFVCLAGEFNLRITKKIWAFRTYSWVLLEDESVSMEWEMAILSTLITQLQRPERPMSGSSGLSNKEEEGKRSVVVDGKVQNGDEIVEKPARPTAEDLETENRRLREGRTCKICMDNEIGVALLPCGHLVSCSRVDQL